MKGIESMRKVVRFEVNGLFGYADHSVDFRTSAPTILTAPNGAGKTHILTLLNASLSLDVQTLLTTTFSSLRVDLTDGRSLLVVRETTPPFETGLAISTILAGIPIGNTLRVDTRMLESLEPTLPSHLKPSGPSRWLDTRTGRVLNREGVERRFRVKFGLSNEILDNNPELRDLCAKPYPVLIDTKRLDLAGLDRSPSLDYSTAHTLRDESGAASRIHEYTEQLRSEVTEARRGSIHATQSADVSFAARALAAARKTVRETDLHERYDRTVERYEALARNSLAVGEAPIPFPDKTTPTDRRILNVFLDDWDKRLEPLLPLNEKIQTLRDILDSKLEPSGKTTAMSPRGGLEFRGFSGARIRVANLSSGEQHLVALFTMLLFSAQAGSLVLIDEPEISLHAGWKHAFLDDISRVATIGSLQIVLATHSTGIINGRWDLTEELKLSASRGSFATASVADRLEEDDNDDIDS
ncbi:AAA family ATPase [Occultella kanbiaonis]|uniref:AAA family ATPase n=1 Tax=Occultella kanbiaonis TaxID=2675754 RepID=UPI001A98C354|nr:AAA family ATPase [Occultella kanbiaonis]